MVLSPFYKFDKFRHLVIKGSGKVGHCGFEVGLLQGSPHFPSALSTSTTAKGIEQVHQDTSTLYFVRT